MPSAPPNSSQVKVFLNSAGGSADDAKKELEAAGLEVEEIPANQLKSRLERAIAEGSRRLLVAGGDGTIGTGAALVAKTHTELAVLPAGTLNHFAKDHGIPTDLAEAAAVALNGTVGKADLGYLHDDLFLNTSSIGAYVTFVRVRERFEKNFGYTIASFLALVRVFSSMRTFGVELEVEGRKKSYRTALVFIGVGERELQLPKLGSRVQNGKRGLHVMIVQGRRPARLFAIAMAAVARGTKGAAALPQFDAFLVDSCEIDLGRPDATIALDGELKRMETPLRYRIERDAIRLVVPAERGSD